MVYILPQWLQISEFHEAVVCALYALTEKERQLDARVRNIEQTRLQVHLFALQQKIAVLQPETPNWRAASQRWKRKAYLLSTPNKPVRHSSTHDEIRSPTLTVL